MIGNLSFDIICSSRSNLFTVANSHYQLSWYNQIILFLEDLEALSFPQLKLDSLSKSY